MDRTLFLKALPFLNPLDDDIEWPPTNPLAGSDPKATTTSSISVEDHHLSIEALAIDEEDEEMEPSQEPTASIDVDDHETDDEESANDDTRGPAFFSSNDAVDPALCKIDLVLFSNGRSKLETPKRFGRQSPRKRKRLLVKETMIYQSALFLSIQEASNTTAPQYFQVDLNSILNVKMVEPSTDSSRRSSSNENAQTEPPKTPLSLLFFFADVGFRLLSLRSSADRNSSLRKLKDKLVELLTADTLNAPFPVKVPKHQGGTAKKKASPAVASPVGKNSPANGNSAIQSETSFESSSGTVVEPGQKMVASPLLRDEPSQKKRSDPESGTVTSQEIHDDGTDSNQLLQTPQQQQQQQQTSSSNREQDVQPQSTYCAASKIASFHHLYQDLASFTKKARREIGVNCTTGDMNACRSDMMSLLNSIPRNLAGSYCSVSEMEDATAAQTDAALGCKGEMQDLVDQLWPTKAATTTLPTTQPPRDDEEMNGAQLEHPPVETPKRSSGREILRQSGSVLQAEDIFARHQAALDLGNKIGMLPVRGSTQF